ncbi:hypothetical protein O3S80_06765 [Streptomyces sp. Lzd4kr]|nr:hypothetical protein [Streptomyces sp. Lzd4kr]
MPVVVWGPSTVAVDLGLRSKLLGQPFAMTREQIDATVARFGVTARRAERAGFDGVQIHATHSYVLSQFLSPLVNRRTDAWGRSFENQARMLLDVVREVRVAVAPSFAVAVKPNSAGFQRGGFDMDDADPASQWSNRSASTWSNCWAAAKRARPCPVTRPTSAPGPAGHCPQARVRRICWRTSALPTA